MIRRQDKQRLRAIYAFSCGYCSISESEMGAELTVDHFQPHSAGGDDSFDNLVYCCHACNAFKGQSWDLETPPILHPLRSTLGVHFTQQSDGTLLSLTEAGERHITTLHLNRDPLVRYRQRARVFQSAVEGQQSVETRIESLEKALRDLTAQITRRKSRLP